MLCTSCEQRQRGAGRDERTLTHVSLELLAANIWLYAHEVAQHPRHRIITKDDDLLVEELDATWVACHVDMGHA